MLAVMKQSMQPVLFEYRDEHARKVCIAGSFNDWKPDGLDMIDMGQGKWAKNLLLAPGIYEYRLVVDGKWICDPRARNSAPNPFGELNSILQVTGHPVSANSSWSGKGCETVSRVHP